MSSYAVLGATGNAGQALLGLLLQTPDNQVHAFCRSRAKLEKLSSGITENKQVHVFEGSLEDIETLATCMSGTDAVFMAIGQTNNQPGCTVARDAAQSIASALERMKMGNQRLPKLVFLSSASLDHRLMSHVPQILLNTLYCAFSSIYDDLREAEIFLRSKESLVSTTFVRPGALSHDKQKGHYLSLDSARSPISFLDLAAGMIEVANEGSDRYDMKGVAVNSSAEDVAFPWEAPLLILKGLIFHYFPWTYQYLG
ncbi:Monooxygenase aflX [Paramyrothecium foliicola]|nr:Monooxygenase aflX [Paramyrothecium foliicola]